MAAKAADAADVREDAQAPEPEACRTLGDRLHDLSVKGIELTDKVAVSSSADEIRVPHNDCKYCIAGAHLERITVRTFGSVLYCRVLKRCGLSKTFQPKWVQ